MDRVNILLGKLQITGEVVNEQPGETWQSNLVQDLSDRVTDLVLGELGPYTFGEGNVAGMQALVSRTGYTGEDGFELIVPAAHGLALWTRLLSDSDISLNCR